MLKRIRIFFIGCPTLDLGATSYLLLSQNSVQQEVQFEIYHYWIYGSRTHKPQESWFRKFVSWYGDTSFPFSTWLDRRNRAWLDYRMAPMFKKKLSYEKWFDICQSAIQSYDEWFKKSHNNKYDVLDCPTIIITEAPIKGGFISFAHEDIGLISTANWKRYFRPVSALDYILTSTQRLTMRLAFTKQIGSHYPTRGCIWDYDDHQPDARIGILLGHICQICESKLISAAGQPGFSEIAKLVGNRWLGDKSQQYTPASVLANVYRYDLSRSTGLNTNFIRKAFDSLSSELAKIASEGIKWTLVVIITLTLSAYFPKVLREIKLQFADSSENVASAQQQKEHPLPIHSKEVTSKKH